MYRFFDILRTDLRVKFHTAVEHVSFEKLRGAD